MDFYIGVEATFYKNALINNLVNYIVRASTYLCVQLQSKKSQSHFSNYRMFWFLHALSLFIDL